MTANFQRQRLYTPKSGLRRRGNPYFRKNQTDNFGSSLMKNTLAKLSPKFWFWLFVLIVVGLVLGWLLFLSNVLVIKKIEIKGTSIISQTDLQQLAQERLSRSRWWFFSESRLMVFNANGLKKTLNDRYALDNIKIIKKIPSTLTIIISEKTPAAVWFEADTYQEIDAAGWILAPVTGPLDNLPTIYNNGQAKINDKKVVDQEKTITFARDLQASFDSRFSNLKLKQLLVTNDKDTLTLVPEKGGMIYFSTVDPLNAQLDRLDILIKTELKDRWQKIHYIDLRFGTKVYYQ